MHARYLFGVFAPRVWLRLVHRAEYTSVGFPLQLIELIYLVLSEGVRLSPLLEIVYPNLWDDQSFVFWLRVLVIVCDLLLFKIVV